MSSRELTIAVFPGAANAPLFLALDRGWLADANLDVNLIEVASSKQQMDLWDGGACEVMHTSPDHLIREPRGREPVVVRCDGFGELSVYAERGPGDLAAVKWAVDGLDSGFAFVLRALLADRCELPVAEQQLIAIGGTKQRYDALREGAQEVGGTMLHPPFDELAARLGFKRLAGHRELLPDLVPVATVVARNHADSDSVRIYLEVVDRAIETLLAEGPKGVAAVLEGRGLPPDVAEAAGEGILGPGGLSEDRAPTLATLQAPAELRARFDPSWSRPAELGRMLEAGFG